jgi:hypothetical protein
MSSYANTQKRISSFKICDHEGRFTLQKIYHAPRVVVRILLELLATVSIILSRTGDKRARNEPFGISLAAPKFIFTLFHCS